MVLFLKEYGISHTLLSPQSFSPHDSTPHDSTPQSSTPQSFSPHDSTPQSYIPQSFQSPIEVKARRCVREKYPVTDAMLAVIRILMSFQMRVRISIRGRVRPLVRRSVGPSVGPFRVIFEGEKNAYYAHLVPCTLVLKKSRRQIFSIKSSKT